MRRIVSALVVLIASTGIASAQKLSEVQTAAAKCCCTQILQECKAALPADMGIIRTDCMDIVEDMLVYVSTVKDLNTYLLLEANKDKLCSIEHYRATLDQNGLIYCLLADLGMGLENIYRTPSGAREFSLKLSNEKLKEVLGGTVDEEVRRKVVGKYLDSQMNERTQIFIKGDEMHFYMIDSRPFIESYITKNTFYNTMDSIYESGDSGTINYNLCIYCGLDFHGFYQFKDKTIDVVIPNKDIIKTFKANYKR